MLASKMADGRSRRKPAILMRKSKTPSLDASSGSLVSQSDLQGLEDRVPVGHQDANSGEQLLMPGVDIPDGLQMHSGSQEITTTEVIIIIKDTVPEKKRRRRKKEASNVQKESIQQELPVPATITPPLLGSSNSSAASVTSFQVHSSSVGIAQDCAATEHVIERSVEATSGETLTAKISQVKHCSLKDPEKKKICHEEAKQFPDKELNSKLSIEHPPSHTESTKLPDNDTPTAERCSSHAIDEPSASEKIANVGEAKILQATSVTVDVDDSLNCLKECSHSNSSNSSSDGTSASGRSSPIIPLVSPFYKTTKICRSTSANSNVKLLESSSTSTEMLTDSKIESQKPETKLSDEPSATKKLSSATKVSSSPSLSHSRGSMSQLAMKTSVSSTAPSCHDSNESVIICKPDSQITQDSKHGSNKLPEKGKVEQSGFIAKINNSKKAGSTDKDTCKHDVHTLSLGVPPVSKFGKNITNDQTCTENTSGFKDLSSSSCIKHNVQPMAERKSFPQGTVIHVKKLTSIFNITVKIPIKKEGESKVYHKEIKLQIPKCTVKDEDIAGAVKKLVLPMLDHVLQPFTVKPKTDSSTNQTKSTVREISNQKELQTSDVFKDNGDLIESSIAIDAVVEKSSQPINVPPVSIQDDDDDDDDDKNDCVIIDMPERKRESLLMDDPGDSEDVIVIGVDSGIKDLDSGGGKSKPCPAKVDHTSSPELICLDSPEKVEPVVQSCIKLVKENIQDEPQIEEVTVKKSLEVHTLDTPVNEEPVVEQSPKRVTRKNIRTDFGKILVSELVRVKTDPQTNKVMFICKVCCESFPYHSRLKEHLETMHSNLPSTVVCIDIDEDSELTNAQEVRKIPLHKTEDSSEASFDITSSADKNSLSADLISSDVSSSNSISVCPFLCEFCPLRFRDFDTVQRHMSNVHQLNRQNKVSTNEIVTDAVIEKLWIKPKIFKNREEKMKYYSYYCEVCDKGFYTNHSYQRHIANHSGKVYNCTECSFSTVIQVAYAGHMRIHKKNYNESPVKKGNVLIASNNNSPPTETAIVKEVNSTPVETGIVKKINVSPMETAIVKKINSSPTETTTVKEVNSSPTETTTVKEVNSSPTETTTVKEVNSSPTETTTVKEVNSSPTETTTVKEVNSSSTKTAFVKETGFKTRRKKTSVHSLKSSLRTYQCLLCSFSSVGHHAYAGHMRTHKGSAQTGASSRKFYPCKLCSFYADTLIAYARHMKYHKCDKRKMSTIETEKPCKSVVYPDAKSVEYPDAKSVVYPDAKSVEYPDAKSVANPDAVKNPKKVNDTKSPNKGPCWCTYCGKEFLNNGALVTHVLHLHNEKKFVCSKCPAAFSINYLRELHEKKHSMDLDLQCNMCTFSTHDKSEFLDHEKVHVNTIGLLCNFCSFVSKDKEELFEHIGTLHKYGCKECPFTTDKESLLIAHLVETKHSLTAKVAPEKDSITSAATNITKPKHPCSQCNFLATSEKSLHLHVRAKHQKFHKCSYCSFRSYSLKKYLTHTKSSHRRSIECPFCPYSTRSPYRMIKHEQQHRTGQLYKCKHCSFSTTERWSYEKHLQSNHQSKKPFRCEKCNYGTSYRHNLRRHFVKHYAPVYECDFCTYCTMVQDKFHLHMEMNHTSLKTIACAKCTLLFESQTQLNRHIHIKHGDAVSEHIVRIDISAGFRCEECNFKVQSVSELEKHWTQDGTCKTHKCNKCVYYCSSEEHLLEHQQIHCETPPVEQATVSPSCYQCGLPLSSIKELITHKKKHIKNDGLMHCRICKISVVGVDHYEKHMATHHADKIQCEICPYKAPQLAAVVKHQELHCDDFFYKCDICLFSVDSEIILDGHKILHATSPPDSSVTYLSRRNMIKDTKVKTRNVVHGNLSKTGTPSKRSSTVTSACSPSHSKVHDTATLSAFPEHKSKPSALHQKVLKRKTKANYGHCDSGFSSSPEIMLSLTTDNIGMNDQHAGSPQFTQCTLSDGDSPMVRKQIPRLCIKRKFAKTDPVPPSVGLGSKKTRHALIGDSLQSSSETLAESSNCDEEGNTSNRQSDSGLTSASETSSTKRLAPRRRRRKQNCPWLSSGRKKKRRKVVHQKNKSNESVIEPCINLLNRPATMTSQEQKILEEPSVLFSDSTADVTCVDKSAGNLNPTTEPSSAPQDGKTDRKSSKRPRAKQNCPWTVKKKKRKKKKEVEEEKILTIPYSEVHNLVLKNAQKKNKTKMPYICKFCERGFNVAEEYQRHHFRHLQPWNEANY
uniref:Uncharacterized protein LOC102805851 n=1 Tax=Saccoglossus kowalevskii TaxID=10224 RepID=A0ABM0MIG7_SACKO|nr:PREDICTED: uncharacterized protein LOC102805851 [Saccoglossus kowalevskii]